MHLNNYGLEESDAEGEISNESTISENNKSTSKVVEIEAPDTAPNLNESIDIYTSLKRQRSNEANFTPKNGKRAKRNIFPENDETSPSAGSSLANETIENVSKTSNNEDDTANFGEEFPSYASIMTPEKIQKEFREKIVYKQGDVIWGKCKNYSMWPAVVFHVYPKKLTIFWLPNDIPLKSKKGFPISTSKVEPFLPNKEKNCIQQDGTKRLDRAFLNARIQAEKILENSINPFKDSLPVSQDNYQLAEDITEEDADEKPDVVEVTESSSTCAFESKPIIFSNETNRMIEQRKKNNQNLLDNFKTDECKIYVKKLINEEVETDRTRRWNEMIMQRKTLQQIPPCLGPIIDDDQICRGSQTLVDQYYDEKPEEKSNTLVVKYVIDVLLPEAIKFAMQKVLGYDETEAENVLNTTHMFTDQERKEHLRQIRSPTIRTTFDDD